METNSNNSGNECRCWKSWWSKRKRSTLRFCVICDTHTVCNYHVCSVCRFARPFCVSIHCRGRSFVNGQMWDAATWVLSRQYVRDQCWSAESTELGSVEVAVGGAAGRWRFLESPCADHRHADCSSHTSTCSARALPSHASRLLHLHSKGNQSLPPHPLQTL